MYVVAAGLDMVMSCKNIFKLIKMLWVVTLFYKDSANALETTQLKVAEENGAGAFCKEPRSLRFILWIDPR